MYHYVKVIVPVPAVIVVVLNPPDAAGVEATRPAPIVIVSVSRYLRITIPEPPDFEPVFPPLPPAPPPLLAVPLVPFPPSLIPPVPPPPRPPAPP